MGYDEAEVANEPKATQPQSLEGSNSYVEAEYDRWSEHNGIWRPATPTKPRIRAGIYEANSDPKGIYFEARRFPSDTLIDLPGLPTAVILNEIKEFWKKRAIFEHFGYLHKRGFMMCGPGGCGKTSIIRMVCDDIIARDGIALLIHNVGKSVIAMKALRDIEPERPLVTITEDLDEYFRPDQSPKQILSMFDGENQVDHVLHIATTNFPEKLEERIIQRPSRFDMILMLGTPVDGARRRYLQHILAERGTVPQEVVDQCPTFFDPEGNLREEALEKAVANTKGLSLSHVKEFVVSTVCLGKDPEETLARLKANMKAIPKLGGKGGSLGFAASGEGFQIHYVKQDKETA